LRQRVAFLGNRKVLTSETIACLREGVILPWENEPLPEHPIGLLTLQKELKAACKRPHRQTFEQFTLIRTNVFNYRLSPIVSIVTITSLEKANSHYPKCIVRIVRGRNSHWLSEISIEDHVKKFRVRKRCNSNCSDQ
jgi:hypothetical protein